MHGRSSNVFITVLGNFYSVVVGVVVAFFPYWGPIVCVLSSLCCEHFRFICADIVMRFNPNEPRHYTFIRLEMHLLYRYTQRSHYAQSSIYETPHKKEIKSLNNNKGKNMANRACDRQRDNNLRAGSTCIIAWLLFGSLLLFFLFIYYRALKKTCFIHFTAFLT